MYRDSRTGCNQWTQHPPASTKQRARCERARQERASWWANAIGQRPDVDRLSLRRPNERWSGAGRKLARVSGGVRAEHTSTLPRVRLFVHGESTPSQRRAEPVDVACRHSDFRRTGSVLSTRTVLRTAIPLTILVAVGCNSAGRRHRALPHPSPRLRVSEPRPRPPARWRWRAQSGGRGGDTRGVATQVHVGSVVRQSGLRTAAPSDGSDHGLQRREHRFATATPVVPEGASKVPSC